MYVEMESERKNRNVRFVCEWAEWGSHRAAQMFSTITINSMVLTFRFGKESKDPMNFFVLGSLNNKTKQNKLDRSMKQCNGIHGH